jgi:DeoR/GlpR family transcriptional regulator of sugar metabolism
MLAKERQMKILDYLREEGSARVIFLSELLNVSEPTIRQDLDRLEREGHVIRERGGVFLRSVSQQVKSLSLQHTENIEMKKLIGKKASEFVKDGDRLILDSGSTITEMAKHLHGKQNLTVITNAINIALIIGAEFGFELIVTGGEFKAPTLSLTGEKAAHSLADINVDKVFLATGGISPNFELTYPSFSDLMVKRKMIEAASEVFVVADSTKFGRRSLASLGNLSDVDHFITDAGIDQSVRQRLIDLGIDVIVAE